MILDDLLKIYNHIYENLDVFFKNEYLDSMNLSFTHHSTAIEGNTCTLFETHLILDEQILPEGKRLKEALEIIGHDAAIKKLMNYAELKTPVSEDVICDLHKSAMYPAKFAGTYRNTEVYIKGSDDRVSFARNVYQDMKFFIQDLNNSKFNSVLEKVAFTHCKFVKIHPFVDGNGYIARLITNLSLLNDGYPLLVIKADDNSRESYLKAVYAYGKTGNLQPFVDLLESIVKVQLSEFICKYNEMLPEDKRVSNLDIDKVRAFSS